MVPLPVHTFQTQLDLWWCLVILLFIRSRVPVLVLYVFCKPLLLFSIPNLTCVPYLSWWWFHLYSDHQGWQVSIPQYSSYPSEVKYTFLYSLEEAGALESDWSISVLQAVRCVTLGILLTHFVFKLFSLHYGGNNDTT